MAYRPVREFEKEVRQFWAWARWASKTDGAYLMKLCGLTWAGSIPTFMMSIADTWDVNDDGSPIVYDTETKPDYSACQLVQAFMEDVADEASRKALIARHLRRVNGEFMLVSNEGRIAEALYDLPRNLAHPRLLKDCSRGYSDYKTWSQAQAA